LRAGVRLRAGEVNLFVWGRSEFINRFN